MSTIKLNRVIHGNIPNTANTANIVSVELGSKTTVNGFKETVKEKIKKKQSLVWIDEKSQFEDKLERLGDFLIQNEKLSAAEDAFCAGFGKDNKF
ncbi:11484_t:CDS:2 [Gigaspora rosea]|nr:11484_t:CDS:2 [Gigaspora rosea]